MTDERKEKLWHIVSGNGYETLMAMEVPNGILFKHKCHDGGETNVSNISLCFVHASRGHLKKWLNEDGGESIPPRPHPSTPFVKG